MVIEQISPDTPMSLLVYGGGLQSKMGAPNVSASFLPFTRARFENGKVAQTDKGKDTAIYWVAIAFLPRLLSVVEERKRRAMKVRDLALEAEDRAESGRTAAAITGLEIQEIGRTSVLLTGPLGKANAMMKQCSREQLASWGIDPAVQDRIVQNAEPIAPVQKLFKDADYPRSAVKSGDESVQRARLLIDETGAVTKCTSLTAFAAPEFADLVCSRLKLAKFKPAESADGTKLPDYYVSHIFFRMAP